MFNLSLQLQNRWITDDFKNFWCKSFHVVGHKFGELQLTHERQVMLSVMARATTHQDHSGCEFEFGLLSLVFAFRVYDNRHWDYNNNCFINQ